MRGEREPFTAHPLKKSPQCLPEAKKKELKELKKQNAKGAKKGSSINKVLKSKVKVKGDEKDKMPPPGSTQPWGSCTGLLVLHTAKPT